MAETPQSIQRSMELMIAGLKDQLDELSADIFSLKNGKRKYTAAERDELNNVRSKLVQEIFHRELMAAFDAATVTVVRQPTLTEVENLKATMIELSQPLDALNSAFAVVNFVEDLMSKTVKSLNVLGSTLQPKV